MFFYSKEASKKHEVTAAVTHIEIIGRYVYVGLRGCGVAGLHGCHLICRDDYVTWVPVEGLVTEHFCAIFQCKSVQSRTALPSTIYLLYLYDIPGAVTDLELP